jgi:hypothetical protein
VGKTPDTLKGKSVIVDASGIAKVRCESGANGMITFIPQVVNEEVCEDAAAFRCDAPRALEAVHSGALQIVTEDGHFLIRCSGEQVWMVYEVPAVRLSDSFLVGQESYLQAIREALD